MILHIDQIQIKIADECKLSMDGNIYFSFGTICFPEYQWFDMISIDLENWIPQLISFAENHTDFCVLTFMDGPYQIKLTRQPSRTVTAICLEDQKIRLDAKEIDFSKFLKSLAAGVSKLGTAIYKTDEKHRFESEISQLGALSKKLRSCANIESDCHAGEAHI